MSIRYSPKPFISSGSIISSLVLCLFFIFGHLPRFQSIVYIFNLKICKINDNIALQFILSISFIRKGYWRMKLAADLQCANKALILRHIYENEPISRINLSKKTGLNKATVSTIVHDFLEAGLLRENGIVLTESGRKSIGLELNMENFACVVIRIKRNHILSAVYDLKDNLKNARSSLYTDSLQFSSILDQIEQEINLQLEYCQAENTAVLGISIATLGPLFCHNGNYTLHVDGFHTLSEGDIFREISSRFPDHCILMNHDANASAVAELRSFVKEQGYQPSVFLSVVCGVGIGSGILVDGKLLRGFHGTAGEIGHLGINCFVTHKGINSDIQFSHSVYEEFASPAAMQRSLIEHLYDYPDSTLTSSASLEDIYTAYDQGDPLAIWAVNRMARFLAYGLAGLVFTLDPEIIVLGDEIPHSEKFRNSLNKFMDEYLPAGLKDGLKIRFSDDTADTSLSGAGIMLATEMMQTGKILECIDKQLRCQR